MDELDTRIKELMGKRFHCSQIMVILSEELRGRDNPELIRALAGLGGGMWRQKTCGTLTGSCCLLSSYVAKALPDEKPRKDYKKLTEGFVTWFEAEFGHTDCRDLVEWETEKVRDFCPGLMAKAFAKCMELLEEQGINIYE